MSVLTISPNPIISKNLGKLCAQIDPEFTSILPLDNKFHRRSFRRLQRAYIEARYSEHYEITVEELDYPQGEVEKLKGLVRVCVGGRFAGDEWES
ncbi:hypothetical protein P4S72_15905 [Vibrio sp. PP-XX7]